MIRELFRKHEQVIRYLIVGGLTTVVSLGCYFLCVSTFLDPQDPVQLQAANILSWTAAVTFAYAANRKHVFHSRNSNILKEAAAFCGSRVGTLGVEMVMMFVMVSLMKMNDKAAKLIVQVVITVLNYIISKFLVFRTKKTDS